MMEEKHSGGGGRWSLPAALREAEALRAEYQQAVARGQSRWRGVDIEALQRPGGGKMFGVMRARDPGSGEQSLHYAFSGQLEGDWSREGWVGPIFDEARWRALEAEQDPQIKAFNAQIEAAAPGSSQRAELKAQRKAKSLALLDAYLDLYEIRALSGARCNVRELFGGKRPPTGTGDCCAPKLLALAVDSGLEVQALSEIFLGSPGPSKTRVDGEVYPPCAPKCGPILDFVLCAAAQGDDTGL